MVVSVTGSRRQIGRSKVRRPLGSQMTARIISNGQVDEKCRRPIGEESQGEFCCQLMLNQLWEVGDNGENYGDLPKGIAHGLEFAVNR